MIRSAITTWPSGIDPFQSLPSLHEGLNFAFGPGKLRDGTTVVQVNPGVVTLNDNATNFIYAIPSAGTVNVALTEFPANTIPLFEVTTAAGLITNTLDKRTPWMLPAEGSMSVHGNEFHDPDFTPQSTFDSHAGNADAHKGQKNSVVVDAGDLQLDGDAASPGNDRYYGTNNTGTKGYYPFPEGGGSVAASDDGVEVIAEASEFDFKTGLDVTDDGTGTAGVTVNSTEVDHNSLQNYVLNQHRALDDATTTTTNLWSAQKIQNEIDGAVSGDSPFATSWENVKTHGAVGDGVANDSTAFQAALDAAGDGVGVLLPAGTYLVNVRLQVKSGTVVMGVGIDQSIIDSRKPSGATETGDDNTLFITQHSGAHTENIAFLDFTAQTVNEDPATGDRTQVAIWRDTGAGADRPEGLRVERCKLDLFRRPLRGSSSTSGIGSFLIVRNCQILNFLGSALARMNVERSWIINNFFDRPVADSGDGFGRAIYFATHGKELHIVGNKMVNGAGGIHARNAGTFQELLIANNYVNSPSTALNNVLFIGGDTDSNVAVVTGNIFIGDNGTGTSSGVCARIRMNHAVVTGNLFEHHTGGGSTGSIGVAIDADDVFFSANKIRSTVADPQYGLSTTGNRNRIVGNDFEYPNVTGRDIVWLVSGALRSLVQGNSVYAQSSTSSGILRAFSGANENTFINNTLYTEGGLRDDGLDNNWIRNVAIRANNTVIDPFIP